MGLGAEGEESCESGGDETRMSGTVTSDDEEDDEDAEG
jgi:hypothetical protein